MEVFWYVMFVLICLLIFMTLIMGNSSHKKISKIYEKYLYKYSQCNITALELAQVLISKAEIDIAVDIVNSKNSNIYSPKYKILKLTDEVANSISLLSLAKVCQEIGHAIQDTKGNFGYKLKKIFYPIIKFMTSLFLPTVLIGFLFRFSFNKPVIGFILSMIGLIFIMISIIFHLLTINTENKSSECAGNTIDKCEFFTEDEIFALKDIFYVSSSIYTLSLVTNLFFFLNFFKIPTLEEIQNNK